MPTLPRGQINSGTADFKRSVTIGFDPTYAPRSGDTYIVPVDRCPGYAWTEKLRRTDTQSVSESLTGSRSLAGRGTSDRTDGGAQNRGEFAEYCAGSGIMHELASAYNSKCNGLAEAAVKNMKYPWPWQLVGI